MSDYFDFLALGISGIGILVSLLARRDSHRSANASEISAEASVSSATAAKASAEESLKQRKISQCSVLSPYFIAVNDFLSALNGDITDLPKLFRMKEAIDYLKTALPSDKELYEVLRPLEYIFENKELRRTMQSATQMRSDSLYNLASYAPGNLQEIRNRFFDLKKKHLSLDSFS